MPRVSPCSTHSFLDLALSEIYSKIAGCTIGGPIDSLCVHKYYDQGQWKLKSIQNATYFQGDADAAFVGDIQIQVVE